MHGRNIHGAVPIDGRSLLVVLVNSTENNSAAGNSYYDDNMAVKQGVPLSGTFP
jgi:hypothetical protein